ncbi:hypothetical protein KPL74_06755 [Bacillus sp. NP157]|nr:hypothetical protein KPL74_06755 [Bacillus sp. NP157]
MNGRNSRNKPSATFDPPFVRGAVNDHVDPGQGNVYLVIPLDIFIEKGDEIVVTLRVDDGSSREETLHATNDDAAASMHLTPAYLAACDGHSVTASYSVTGKANSLPYQFSVGQIGPALPVPIVAEAAGDNLDPVAAQRGATVEIHAQLSHSDTVVVHFGEYSSAPVNGKANLKVVIPPGEVARVLGEAVDVVYTVNEKRTSPALVLHVLNFHEDDARLPLPSIREAFGTAELDLLLVHGSAHASVSAWPLMAEGQVLWMDISWEGGEIAMFTAHRLTAAEAGKSFTVAIVRDELDRMSAGTPFILRLRVTFNGSTRESEAITFRVHRYTLLKTLPIDIDRTPVTLKVGEKYQRSATNGKLPYRYESLVPSVVRVTDAAQGDIVAVARGESYIMVSDATGEEVPYHVYVT